MSANPKWPTSPQGPTMEAPPGLPTTYSNLARIAHTPSELVFEFAHLLPGTPTAQIFSRVVMSPLGAKLFLRALHENLARFESAFGEIKIPGESTLVDQLFRPPEPPNKE